MNSETTIQITEEICPLTIKTRNYQTWERESRQKHTIVYVGNPYDVEEVFPNMTQPEITQKGENLENDKAWRKYNKAEVAIQKRIIDVAVADGLLDQTIAQGLKFSRTAGCSCGCSAGWISRDYGRRSIWLTARSPRKEAKRAEIRAEAQSKYESDTLSSMVI